MKLSPRAQTWVTSGLVSVAVVGAVIALVMSNSSATTAGNAADVAQQGAAACKTQVKSYAAGLARWQAIRAAFKAQATLDRKTASGFGTIANLSTRPNAAQTLILQLALAYASAATQFDGLRDTVTLPPRPTCGAT